MRILEFGDSGAPALLLIHGFESPYQIWEPYIERYVDTYHILVPILPGHDVQESSEFVSFADTAREIEAFCAARGVRRLHAVYGMSMGGVLAALLWQNGALTFDNMLLESAPLLPFGRAVTGLLTRQYLRVTQKARERDGRTLQNAVRAMVTAARLDALLALLDHISDRTIESYLQEAGAFRLPPDIDTPDTRLVYMYGGSMSELVFWRVARYIRRHYPRAQTRRLPGKGHCEDALLHPAQWLDALRAYL